MSIERTQVGSPQRGVALVIALLFLVVVTVLGVATMTTSTMEERMAGYSRDQVVALQAAEAAMRDAEREVLYRWSSRGSLFFGATGFSADCGSDDLTGFCLVATSDAQMWNRYLNSRTPAFISDKGVEYGEFSYRAGDSTDPPPPLPDKANPGGVAAPPKYIVEADTRPYPGDDIEFGANLKNPRYRITALGFGASADTQVMVQEVVKPY